MSNRVNNHPVEWGAPEGVNKLKHSCSKHAKSHFVTKNLSVKPLIKESTMQLLFQESCEATKSVDSLGIAGIM